MIVWSSFFYPRRESEWEGMSARVRKWEEKTSEKEQSFDAIKLLPVLYVNLAAYSARYTHRSKWIYTQTCTFCSFIFIFIFTKLGGCCLLRQQLALNSYEKNEHIRLMQSYRKIKCWNKNKNRDQDSNEPNTNLGNELKENRTNSNN